METQNLPEEAPIDEKQRLRRRSNEKSQEEGQQEHPRGAQDGPLAPEKLPRDPQEHPRGAQEPPKKPSRAPKRSPGDAQNALRTMVGSKTSILQNSSNVLAKIDDFEGQRVILGAQNRPREGRRGERTRLRRRYEPKKVSRELWKVLGESLCRIPRVQKALGGSMCRIRRAWRLSMSTTCRYIRHNCSVLGGLK